MTEGTRGWQQLTLKPEVWNKHRAVSICANLSSTDGSIATPRGRLSGAWQCLTGGNGSTCGVFDEHDTMELDCGEGGNISTVDFASFGTPNGTCATTFAVNPACNAPSSKTVVEKACLGKPSCLLQVATSVFGADPCFDDLKYVDRNLAALAPWVPSVASADS